MASVPQSSSSSDSRRRKDISENQRQESVQTRSRASSSNTGSVRQRPSSSRLSAVKETANENDVLGDFNDENDEDDERIYDSQDNMGEGEPDTFSGPLHYVSVLARRMPVVLPGCLRSPLGERYKKDLRKYP